MKTIEELYKEVLANKELKEKFVEAVKSSKVEEFLKSQGCDATAEELKTFLDSKKEVSLEELDAVAGGCSGCNPMDAVMSAFSVGVACAVTAIVSAASGGSVSTKDLCA